MFDSQQVEVGWLPTVIVMTMAHPPLGEESTVSEVVIEAVAEAEGIDPVELTPPLYDVIDPDALERFFCRPPSADQMQTRVTFPYSGYEVTVTDGGAVNLTARDT